MECLERLGLCLQRQGEHARAAASFSKLFLLWIQKQAAPTPGRLHALQGLLRSLDKQGRSREFLAIQRQLVYDIAVLHGKLSVRCVTARTDLAKRLLAEKQTQEAYEVTGDEMCVPVFLYVVKLPLDLHQAAGRPEAAVLRPTAARAAGGGDRALPCAVSARAVRPGIPARQAGVQAHARPHGPAARQDKSHIGRGADGATDGVSVRGRQGHGCVGSFGFDFRWCVNGKSGSTTCNT